MGDPLEAKALLDLLRPPCLGAIWFAATRQDANYGLFGIYEIALLILALLVLPGWLLWSRSRYQLFKGTLARTLVIVFAALLMIVGGPVYLHLQLRETRLIRADPLARLDPHTGIRSSEARLVRRAKRYYVIKADRLRTRAIGFAEGPTTENPTTKHYGYET